MKKKIRKKLLAALCVTSVAVSALTGCGAADGNTDDTGNATETIKGQEITVVSREDGSGTRSAFIELTGVARDGQDLTTMEAIITNSTEIMLTTVAGDARAIGYASLGAMNDTVKAVTVNGVAATSENVKNGSYALARPFQIAVRADISKTAQDFISFIMSADGQSVIEDNGYIALNADAPAFESNGADGKIVVAGSSSVTPVMEKLQEAYLQINSNAQIELQESDSTTGMTQAIDGTCDIGMASRDLKESELKAGLQPTAIAMDGICIVVNPKNPCNDLSTDEIAEIFQGVRTEW